MSKPIYYNIYEKIRKDIISGVYSKNKVIPSERDLMVLFNVSRTTIRQALFHLQNDGYIYKIQGKGNFVSSKLITQNLNNFYSFHNQIISVGKTPTSKVVFSKIIECDDRFSEIFGINVGNNIYHIKRLRLIDGEVAMIEDTYIPEYRFKDFKFDKLNKEPMYEIFKKEYNVIFSSAKEKFKPIKIKDKEDIKYLQIKKDDIVMQIIRTTYEMNKVIEYTKSKVKNDVFEYTVNLNL